MRKRDALVRGWVDKLGVKIGRPSDLISTLSGGNQQKIVLAKWLATEPKLLILDSPTVGVDFQGKDGIYSIVRELAAKGIAVILISDEIPEVLYHCDRIFIMRDGRFTGEFMAHRSSEAEIGEAVYA